MAREPGVEIFSIGTELVMGRIQDTNAFWMAQELVDLGALMRRITVLPDDIDTILEAFVKLMLDPLSSTPSRICAPHALEHLYG